MLQFACAFCVVSFRVVLTELYYVVLCLLCCAVCGKFVTVSCCFFYCVGLRFAVLCCVVMCCVVSCGAVAVVLCCVVFCFAVSVRYITLQYITLYYITLQQTTHCLVLYCIA